MADDTKALEPEFDAKIDQIIDALEASTELKWVKVQRRRTIAYQDGLYNQPHDGKDNDGDGKVDEADEKVTNAKGGQSPHNFGLGCDIAPIKPGTKEVWWDAPEKYWVALCNIAEGLGMTSGYRFNIPGLGKDRPHVEDPKWREQRALWQAGKLHVA